MSSAAMVVVVSSLSACEELWASWDTNPRIKA